MTHPCQQALRVAGHRELAEKLTHLETKYDKQFKVVFDAIHQLMAPETKGKRSIGFAPWPKRQDD